MHPRGELTKYLPTIIIVVGMVSFGIINALQHAVPELSPLWFLLAPFNILLSFVLKHIPPGDIDPTGPWIDKLNFFATPTFAGWLLGSLLISIPLCALNYFLVIRNRYITPGVLCALLLAAIYLPFIVAIVVEQL